MTRIDVPQRAALLIGRVFVADEAYRPAAYALATQMRLSPLTRDDPVSRPPIVSPGAALRRR